MNTEFPDGYYIERIFFINSEGFAIDVYLRVNGQWHDHLNQPLTWVMDDDVLMSLMRVESFLTLMNEPLSWFVRKFLSFNI